MSTNMDGTQLSKLDPSLLGTKAHWDDVYARELDNHSKNNDDEGTVWFDENGAETAVLRLLDSLAESGLLHKSGSQASRILDLGCGNGHMLFELHEGDIDEPDSAWTGPMAGIDYSVASIHLAQQIAQQRGEQHIDIAFHVWDLLQDEPGPWFGTGFDLWLDKGTFDAISLMDESNGDLHPCAVYFERIVSLMHPGNIFVLTSCNWTKAEISAWLQKSQQDRKLRFVAEANYPSFTFGGRSGQSIVTLAFERADS